MEALVSGILASLTWAGLVWLSPAQQMPSPKTWLGGFILFFLLNSGLWLLLNLFNLKLWLLWLVVLLLANGLLSSRLPTPIPNLWRNIVHPAIVTGMVFLLAGALGAI